MTIDFDSITRATAQAFGRAITEYQKGVIALDAGGVNPYGDLSYKVPVRLNETAERIAVTYSPDVNVQVLRDKMPVIVEVFEGGFRLVAIDAEAAGDLLGGSIIKVSAEQIGIFGGASASANGSSGLVPAPAAGQQNSVLRGNGQWSATLLSLTSGVSWYTVSTTAGAATLNATASQTAYRTLATSTTASAVALRQLTTRYLIDAGSTDHVAWTTFTSAASRSQAFTALTDELEIWVQLRSGATATSDGLLLRFNSDSTAANYVSLSSNTTHSATLTTSESLSGASQGVVIANGMTAANSPANWFSFVKIKVSGYNVAARMKLVSWEGFTPADDATGELIKVAGGGMWLNTSAAITSFQMLTTSGSNLAGAYQVIGVGNAN